MKLSILCSDPAHPVMPYLQRWVAENAGRHAISLVQRKSELPGGELLFLVSCREILRAEERAAYRASLVLHASDLPRGRGWSPHIWEIAGGAGSITLSLLEAADAVDSGRIWRKLVIPVPQHALWDEINARLFAAEIEMIDFAVAGFGRIDPVPQADDSDAMVYRRRTPEDSRVDPHASLASQFDKIRVADPQRFPAFFDLRGHRYKLILEKIDGPDTAD
ncbi:hypothetical protein [Rhodocyclus tenuis]|uniref:hypothetical protein n=1 Tax=Rhodocyclus tenuis TaxID=1066 RepID=UPI001907C201|nr:hypothetical protein [Rhodocyclus tenuis]MBK1679957.1 UDP-glucuronic acid dehydrogenase [Rhodocyclus tenuis]